MGNPDKNDFSKLFEDRDSRDENVFESRVQKKWGGIDGLAKVLKTDIRRGIDSKSTQELANEYGVNVMPQKAPKPFLELFFDALQDSTLIILMISAVVSIILAFTVEGEAHGKIEGTAILIAVLIVALVTSGNDYQKEKQFRKLNAAKEDRKIKVWRDGVQKVVQIAEIVVGDIVFLESGDKIPADGLLIQGDDVQVDESSMTGEPDMIKKDEKKNPWMLCGCQVNAGSGTMLVLAVGPLSQWGKIKALVEKESENTPLQDRLENLADLIGKLGFYAALLTFLALFFKWFIRLYNEGHAFGITDIGEVVDFVIVAITIVVVAVPEGLPLAVTISLAYSMFKMMKDNNLVRHLQACETMGGATNICSDKTGTLTENKMTVVEVYANEESMTTFPKPSSEAWHKIVEGCAINSTAYIVKKEKGDEEFVGNKTECALLKLVEKLGLNYEAERKRLEIIKMWPFSSTAKRMSTLIKDGNVKHVTKGSVLYCKGASEIILQESTHFINKDGKVVPIDQYRVQLAAQIENMAERGLRTIGLAYRMFDDIPKIEDSAPAEKLTFIAIAGIKDPVRASVPEAVNRCKRAGIKVRMLTGDNKLTATHIARECGILTGDPKTNVIEGPEFRKLSQEQVDKILPHLEVMARSSPEDKFKLVKRLRELGEVVAVTGDGTNDAPQLKEADVGFSMGITGTEVAKEASDIILLDDNFSSIVKAVMWGRNVFDSIRKFVQFQLTVNLVAVITAFVGAVSQGESPLKAVQMLWVNLIMDTLAALALATEQPSESLLDRKPYGRSEGIITSGMWRTIISQAAFQLVVLASLLWFPNVFPFFGFTGDMSTWNEETRIVHSTIIFNTFVLCQLFNELNCRVLGSEINIFKNFFSNNIFVGVMVFTMIVQILIVQYGFDFAAVRPLSFEQWTGCVLIGLASLPIAVVVKTLFPDRTTKPAVPQQNLSASSEEIPSPNVTSPTKKRPQKTKD